MQSRRDFLRNAVMLAGAGVTAPLWAAMKFDRNAVLRYFYANAAATDARVKAGIEANRKAAKAKPLESLKPTLPRTKENFHKVLRDLLQNVNLTY